MRERERKRERERERVHKFLTSKNISSILIYFVIVLTFKSLITMSFAKCR